MRKTVIMAGLLVAAGTGIACRTPTAGFFGAQFNEAVFRANASIRTFPASMKETSGAVKATLKGLGVTHDGFLVNGELEAKSVKNAEGTLAHDEVEVSRISVSGKTPDGKPLTLRLLRKPEGSEVAVLAGSAEHGNDTVFCNTFLDRVGKALPDQSKEELSKTSSSGPSATP